jgi:hypothetical protein
MHGVLICCFLFKLTEELIASGILKRAQLPQQEKNTVLHCVNGTEVTILEPMDVVSHDWIDNP